MKDYLWDFENNIKLCLLVYGEKNHEGWNIDDSRIWCLSSLSVLKLFYKTFIKILFEQLKERNSIAKPIFL